MQVTQISLTVKQAALLLNRTPRAIVQRIKVGTLKPLNTKRAHSGPDSGYLIPLSQFEYEKRLEFIKQLGIELDESNNPIRRKRSKKGKA
ncbi:MAG: hypothetical protein LBS74_11185, partial [Oscillospiraceae bacterium]|nr:hypothetical protein [Oscillospiraceae bacterium]